jgi:hypothetical protein
MFSKVKVSLYDMTYQNEHYNQTKHTKAYMAKHNAYVDNVNNYNLLGSILTWTMTCQM